MDDRLPVGFSELSSKRSPFEGSEEPESVVIYITGSATDNQYENDRAIERQSGGSKSTINSDMQVRIQRRSRKGHDTTRDGSHDTSSPASSTT